MLYRHSQAGTFVEGGNTAPDCNFWASGLECSPGASKPVSLAVNFFLYWPVNRERRRRLSASPSPSSGYRATAEPHHRRRTEGGGSSSYVPSEHGRAITDDVRGMDDLCLAQWQWAFDDFDQLAAGAPGNRQPLAGHIDPLFDKFQSLSYQS